MERFTQRARRVLSLAQEEAERLQHNYIGTEHLLLGLIREEGGVAGRVLRELGLEQRRVRELVERMTRATTRSSTTILDLSPGTMRVLEMAVDEARRMGHHYIGTEHLLLGLVRQTEGVSIDILKRLGISPEEVRKQTRRVLQEKPVEPTQPAEEEQRSEQKSPEEIVQRSFQNLVSQRMLPLLLTQIVRSGPPERRQEIQTIAEKVLLESISEHRMPISAADRARIIERILAPLNGPDESQTQLRVVIKDKNTGEVRAEMHALLPEVRAAIQLIAEGLAEGRRGRLL